MGVRDGHARISFVSRVAGLDSRLSRILALRNCRASTKQGHELGFPFIEQPQSSSGLSTGQPLNNRRPRRSGEAELLQPALEAQAREVERSRRRADVIASARETCFDLGAADLRWLAQPRALLESSECLARAGTGAGRGRRAGRLRTSRRRAADGRGAGLGTRGCHRGLRASASRRAAAEGPRPVCRVRRQGERMQCRR